MIGKYTVVVRNAHVVTKLTIERNITVIKGSSGTGKTTLVNMISAYNTDGVDSGVTIECEKECVVIFNPKKWKEELQGIKDSIVFFDENVRYVLSKEFAEVIKHTDNYYVIITRHNLNQLPYSIKAILELRQSKRYVTTKQVYNEAFNVFDSN